MFSLKGKTACLIGANGLIGKEIKKALLSSGAKVYLGSRNIYKKTLNNNLRNIKIDISNEKSIKEFIKKVVKESKYIDVWINCAYPKTEYKDVSLKKIETQVMVQDLQAHLLGYFNCCRFIMEHMRKNKKGSIINLGSIYGEIAPDFRIYNNTKIKKDPTYFINKSGIHMMSKYFAVIGAPYNIRINTIAPGGVFDSHSKIFEKQYSSRVPLGRMAQAKEIAGPAVFLSSDASSYITGQTLFVDGGLTAW